MPSDPIDPSLLERFPRERTWLLPALDAVPEYTVCAVRVEPAR